MATLRPFKAWRPHPDLVSEIACLPYDVVHTPEAKGILEKNPGSFMKVIRPESDFQESISTYAPEVYERGKENLLAFLESDSFVQESERSLYVYRIKWQEKVKTGIFGCVSVADYDNGVILKHELTRPDKEDDRTKHIITQKAHAESVILTFRSNEAIRNILRQTTLTEPLYQFNVEDDVEHTIWKMEDHASMISVFDDIQTLYVADGHHRCASASRAAKEVNIAAHPEVEYFPAVLFPLDEVQILAYNRLIYKTSDDIIEKLKLNFSIAENAHPLPDQPGEVRFYYASKWYGLSLPASKHSDIESQLDIARLQEFILEPFFGIVDQRTDTNLAFEGGFHGIEELVQRVDSGEADLAFSMFPTSIEELVAVSDAGQLMPPKSTWFEPKLRSGLLIHTF